MKRRVFLKVSSGAPAIRTLLLLTISAVLLSGCGWLALDQGPTPIIVAADSFTLQWDPMPSALPSQPSNVACYSIYCRPLGSLDWTYLHSTSGADETTIVSVSDLDYGTWEFGVRAIFADERETAIDGSADYSAWPPGGWYLVWQSP